MCQADYLRRFTILIHLLLSIPFSSLQMAVLAKSSSLMPDQACAVIADEATYKILFGKYC